MYTPKINPILGYNLKYIITGAAGFIGFHTSLALLKKGHTILGIDSINNYYDQNLKLDRLKTLKKIGAKKFQFEKINLKFAAKTSKAFLKFKPDIIIHLAAQAGVRYSIENPHSYVNNNLTAFLNVLQSAKECSVQHLVYASTSSVYGANKTLPFSESHSANHPIQFYAATKRSNELMAHSYSHMFQIPTTGLRFFTVYGPWGRPDMALFKFTKNILEGKPIEVFNHGNHLRDFTYVDDIVQGIVKTSRKPPKYDPSFDHFDPDQGKSSAPFRILNIGNSNPVTLMKYIELIEHNLNLKAKIQFLPIQDGDVEKTYSDISRIQSLVSYTPNTDVEVGVKNFIKWYLQYYNQTERK